MEDELILLSRINPVEYEIHRGKIERTNNLVFTTKDKDFAVKLVHAYNEKYGDGRTRKILQVVTTRKN